MSDPNIADSTTSTSTPSTAPPNKSYVDIATMDPQLRQQLEADIYKVIKPWKHRRNKPPFTSTELVIMATVFHHEGCTQLQVQRWILKQFKYYIDLALVNAQFNDGHLLHWNSRTTTQRSESFQGTCALAFRMFDVPLRRVRKVPDTTCLDLWVVSTGAARAFLRSALREIEADEEKKAFPFMRLPPELRNRIYEMALVFPKPGVCVKVREYYSGRRPGSIWQSGQFLLVGREEKRFDEVKWSDLNDAYRDDPSESARHAPFFNDEVIKGPSPSLWLSLLQVSKQLYTEAMPIFYSMNTFMFAEVTQLGFFLEATCPDRRQHIGHVAVHYLVTDETKANKAFKMLKEIPHLRELDINVNEESFKEIPKRKSSELKYPEALKIPGVSHLRSMRGLKAVRFHGECETFQTLIPEMTSEKKKPKAPRKRKANETKAAGKKGKDQADEGTAGPNRKKVG